ncbi:MAG: Dabb family protein [Pseudomonadota bacterium]
MILHCVLMKVRSDAAAGELDSVFDALAALRQRIDGFLAMTAGADTSFEGIARDHTHAFVITFRDREAHLAYHHHPEHEAAGQRLVALCDGGLAGITVVDLDDGIQPASAST